MTRKKIIKTTLITISVLIVIGIGTALYLFNMPHRDVQNTKSDYFLSANEIVEEYLKDKDAANIKYLDAEGESKILEVKGVVAKIDTDFNGQKVVLLQSNDSPAGVSCTFPIDFIEETPITLGQTLTIKGVIRSGAEYNEDLDMYENVLLDKCSLINNK
ncbi:MAG: hypothetical protein CVU03_05485 [Bacteroidetes bacterium HGW-Bacteroidetes-2]|jgi:hypothetical protein|nr:MAG: hypothetical protein CVU03_05485 [Bacteroidetes bacterium HGW-Bacteroidetes-2]